jgi:hypothetical protein
MMRLIIEDAMPTVVTINCPDVVALIEAMAKRFTNGNKTEAVALAMRRLREQDPRVGTLFGCMPGSVTVPEGVDLTASVFNEPTDAETGREPEHR